jgi:phage-related protein
VPVLELTAQWVKQSHVLEVVFLMLSGRGILSAIGKFGGLAKVLGVINVAAGRVITKFLMFALPALILDEIVTTLRGGDTLLKAWLDGMYGVGTTDKKLASVRKEFEKFGPAINNATQSVKGFASDLSLSFLDLVGMGFAQNSKEMQEAEDLFMQHSAIVERGVNVLGDAIVFAFGRSWEYSTKIALAALGIVGGQFIALPARLIDVWLAFVQWWIGKWTWSRDQIHDVLESLVPGLGDVVDSILPRFDRLFASIVSMARSAAQSVIEAFSPEKILSGIESAMSTVGASIKKFLVDQGVPKGIADALFGDVPKLKTSAPKQVGLRSGDVGPATPGTFTGADVASAQEGISARIQADAARINGNLARAMAHTGKSASNSNVHIEDRSTVEINVHGTPTAATVREIGATVKRANAKRATYEAVAPAGT